MNPWALFESIPEMVVVVANNGVILYANAHSFDILGWPPAELIGEPIEVLVPERLHPRHRTDRATYTEPRGRGRWAVGCCCPHCTAIRQRGAGGDCPQPAQRRGLSDGRHGA